MPKKQRAYFYINGHPFKISKDAESESELNIHETKMFVSKESWGYTYLQWANFTGQNLTLKIFNNINESYKGEAVQPDDGSGINDFYNTSRTPNAVLKYWAEKFVPCKVVTNLQSLEDGNYRIKSFKQTNPTYALVETDITLILDEQGDIASQTFWKPVDLTDPTSDNNGSTTLITALSKQIMALGDYHQECKCTATTPSSECTAPVYDQVKTIQSVLRQFGYYPLYGAIGQLNITGKYCYYTTQAVKSVQQDYNLPVTGNFDTTMKSALIKLLGG